MEAGSFNGDCLVSVALRNLRKVEGMFQKCLYISVLWHDGEETA